MNQWRSDGLPLLLAELQGILDQRLFGKPGSNARLSVLYEPMPQSEKTTYIAPDGALGGPSLEECRPEPLNKRRIVGINRIHAASCENQICMAERQRRRIQRRSTAFTVRSRRIWLPARPHDGSRLRSRCIRLIGADLHEHGSGQDSDLAQLPLKGRRLCRRVGWRGILRVHAIRLLPPPIH
ncbi:hypothetical protein CF64_43970 [Bradyrhizobium japonicum]|uniref:Uncharacterized protein n=1 Tax=Bradyrhizobium diazoefficiens TaxID=1355477 RepID=A0A810AJK3_9BRAD|nr:hypothetical protein CF64_43970 [Bradyrhizobium japonicum]BCE19153.1 hypothetical protein XF1B_18340 [Bradyrhizobium diazoefficiens]BCE45407.1 hypothetical protein XF4B_17560 [Bradyrhizobium diazoefficiens]BCE54285.1 hypothetical protein XF5B_17970 [Bradyrhizobium diazoefficiens]BCE63013.1 hypothetical protein XF6B_18120 [Bradyrhizobium diazoefficiens]